MATPTTPGLSSTQPTMPMSDAQGPQQPTGQGLDRAAPPIMQLLSNWQRVSAEIGQVHPQISAPMDKIGKETQSALMVLAREATAQQGQRGGMPTPQPPSSQQPTSY